MKRAPHPSYLTVTDWNERISLLRDMLSPCTVCPLMCGADRFSGKGKCGAGASLRIASTTLHTGEEPPISGKRGSGTIFLSGCPLTCGFCQNYPISQYNNGRDITVPELARTMISLQSRGAHNINFVSPTHFTPQIVEAVKRAAGLGLRIPIVYNSGGYERVEVLKILDGIVDIYLPDMKYFEDDAALHYSGAPRYGKINRAAVREMYRQVGDLVMDGEIAQRGLIVRHLVLPGGIADTRRVLESIAAVSPSITISLMSQYFPAYKAVGIPELNRKLTKEEYAEAVDALASCGLENGWLQPL